MNAIHLTVHPPVGDVLTVPIVPGQYAVGSAESAQIQLPYEGVAEQHVVLWVAEDRVVVDPLVEGVQVNSQPIAERMECAFPVSLVFAGLSLGLELKAGEEGPSQPEAGLEIQSPSPPKQTNAPSSSTASPPATESQCAPTIVGPRSGPPPHPRSGAKSSAVESAQKAKATGEVEAPLQGSYKLVREIARGGMGKIFFGEDAQLERQVAVKVSSVAYGGMDPRFEKEAKVLAQLAHPNIVPIHAKGIDEEGRPYYSMKLVKGRTLQAILNALAKKDPAVVKEYPLSRLLLIFMKVCDAMAFAHSKGILHRDLKPENLMVGEYGEVLVMDWGLAKVRGEREDRARDAVIQDTGDYGMTMEGEVMGTPQYMSPEQAEGMVAELDERSDIYSLGGILYAILTLRAPIDGRTLEEVLNKVKSGQISPMSTRGGGKDKVAVEAPAALGPTVPEALRAVTLKAMSLDRAKRYASVEAFAGDIERYQNGFATQAEEAGALRQLVLFVKRNKGVSAAVALFVVAAALFTVRLAASERVARQNEQKALAQSEKSRRSAAEAQMSLAEAAEAASDSGALRKALDAVPEDLRPADWKYFEERIDTATFTLPVPKGHQWSGVSDWPSRPDRIVALQSNGELFSVDLSTGTLEALWKFNPQGAAWRGPIQVSDDGKWIALHYASAERSGVEIYSLQEGKRVGGFVRPGKGWINLPILVRHLRVASELCLLVGSNSTRELLLVEAWDYRSGQRLWEVSGQYADFCEDAKSVLVVSGSMQAQKREALTGKVVGTGVHPLQFHSWFPAGGVGSKDWETFFSPMGSWTRVRRVNPWNGQVLFELTPRHGSFAITQIPSGKHFATLGRASRQTAVLEIRREDSGQISQSFPFLASVDEGSRPRLFSKIGFVVAATRDALKIWRLPGSVPAMQLRWGDNVKVRLGNTSRMVAAEDFNRARMFSRSARGVTYVDGAASEAGKSILAESQVDFGVSQIVSDRAGDRWVALHDLHDSGKYQGFQLKKGGIEMLWGPKEIRKSGGLCCAVHPLEDRVWTGGAVFSLSSGTVLTTVEDRLDFKAFSPVWVGSNRVAQIQQKEGNTGLALWDAEAGRLLTQVEAPHAVWLSVSADAEQLVEAGSDKKIRIRKAATLEIQRELRVHEEALTGVAWHPTLPFLITAARDGIIRIWSLPDFKKVEEFVGVPTFKTRLDDYFFSRIEVSPDGRELNAYRAYEGSTDVFRPRCFGEGK